MFQRDRIGGADEGKSADRAREAVWGLLGSIRCNLNLGFDSSLKIRPGSGRNWFHFFMFPEEQ